MMITFLLFGCLVKCCLYGGRRAPQNAERLAAQQRFVNEQRRQQLEQLQREQQLNQQLPTYDNVTVKMPLDARDLQMNSGGAGQQYQQQQLRAVGGEQPPPYAHTSSQA